MMEMGSMRFGSAKVDITPPLPIPLAGYASRKADFEGISRPLYVRACLFHQIGDTGETSKALMLQADLIWWGTERLQDLSRVIQEKWDIPAQHIVYHASHTHGGPQTTRRLNPMLGRLKEEYVLYLERKVEEAIQLAHDNLEPVRMERGTGECPGISINRRNWRDGSVVSAPNPGGVNDTEVTVIHFVIESAAKADGTDAMDGADRRDGRTKGVMFHFTCHPTSTGANRITSDYCGAAMEVLDQVLGEGVSCFIQGCCGDIRPRLLNEEEDAFRAGSEDDIGRSGEMLARTVLDILQGPLTPLAPSEIRVWSTQADLPYQRVPSMEELQADMEDSETRAEWKLLLRTDPGRLMPSGTLHLQLLQVAEGLAFLAMDGEIVVEYGLWIKLLSDNQVLPLGYSNGMVGYIPTARQIHEGGYESVSSIPYFGYPAPMVPQIEENIRSGIRELIQCMEHANKRNIRQEEL
ncbi:neutral/alkaline non-lysosomal ceramidase N-terminal domain-containing protein [Paenibacillus eucommiae]|uniref:Neutral/alkaline non-lysosomal ceramidase N-terminal domain-containing protein n=1 Tax=Paenibacillus eucommiae TaxID=1355755 RepID=A0ABS4IZT7_9BACL|nr:neutral/alkaline non-lysosomal ceramidase N-terminal domain-containing protein [Paenibacillus eucommiae]MBP1993102.1 hypothetical protein [Paenibacillus eucommiae]